MLPFVSFNPFKIIVYFEINSWKFLVNNLKICSTSSISCHFWGGASYTKYISQIDKFVNRAFRNGYVTKESNFKEVISEREKKL